MGGGVIAEFEIGKISPSTLRYVKVLHDLMVHFGDLSKFKICEIGVGYGGQARIIFAKFPKVASYTFVDLQSALNLSESAESNAKNRAKIAESALDSAIYKIKAIQKYHF